MCGDGIDLSVHLLLVSNVFLTSYPYLSTLEARKAPSMFPTEAQALHRPNTKPRLEDNIMDSIRNKYVQVFFF